MSVDKSPVYNVRAIPIEKIQANDYNPNVVAPPEMKLLELSIWEDGFTMPCVCYYDEEEDNYILVDGYHRMCICILKNDHACKYMGFALNKEEAYKRDKIMEQFKNMML